MSESEALGPAELAEIQRFGNALKLEDSWAFHVIVADTRGVLDAALENLQLKPRTIRPLQDAGVDQHQQGQTVLDEFERALVETDGAETVLIDLTLRPEKEEAAWAAVFRRLNERRNGLERLMKKPLLLAVPPKLEGSLGQEAPDLWSKRGSGMRLKDRRSALRITIGNITSGSGSAIAIGPRAMAAAVAGKLETRTFSILRPFAEGEIALSSHRPQEAAKHFEDGLRELIDSAKFDRDPARKDLVAPLVAGLRRASDEAGLPIDEKLVDRVREIYPELVK